MDSVVDPEAIVTLRFSSLHQVGSLWDAILRWDVAKEQQDAMGRLRRAYADAALDYTCSTRVNRLGERQDALRYQIASDVKATLLMENADDLHLLAAVFFSRSEAPIRVSIGWRPGVGSRSRSNIERLFG